MPTYPSRLSTFLRLTALILMLGSSIAGQLPLRFEFLGDDLSDAFGGSVSSAGDVNGDGVCDLMISATGDDNNGNLSGSVRVHSGRDGNLLHVFNGNSSNEQFGRSVAAAGDVDGDGFGDLIIGTPQDDDNGLSSGSVRIHSGCDGALIHFLVGDAPFDQLGAAVAGLGDINGDGFGDFAAGADFADPNGVSSGLVRIYSGFDASVFFTFVGMPGDRLGTSVSRAGDVNGDGVEDVIIGSVGASANGPQTGRFDVFSGLDGSLLMSGIGNNGGDDFGISVSEAGDVNQDGFSDVIVGAPREGTATLGPGRARIYSGFNGTVLFDFQGINSDDRLGSVVASAGDVNGDGIADVAVGVPGDDIGGFNTGSVHIYSGGDGQLLTIIVGDSMIEAIGRSVAGVGDLNGDGFDEVLVGARDGFLTGVARVYSACGARVYGEGIDAAQTLTCRWQPGVSPIVPSMGVLHASGASPLAMGIFALSSAPAQSTIGSFTLLVDIAPENAALGFFGFDASGCATTPVNLRQPALEGISIFLQVVEPNVLAPGGVFSSNGVELRFCN